MNYRKEILKELYKFYKDKGSDNYALADTLKVFNPGNREYVNAINQLLSEGLVLSIEYPDKRPAISLNPHMLAVIETELHPWYRDPKFWIGTLIALMGLILAILEFVL